MGSAPRGKLTPALAQVDPTGLWERSTSFRKREATPAGSTRKGRRRGAGEGLQGERGPKTSTSLKGSLSCRVPGLGCYHVAVEVGWLCHLLPPSPLASFSLDMWLLSAGCVAGPLTQLGGVTSLIHRQR